MTTRFALALTFLVAAAASASAQSAPPIIDYTFRVYNVGAPAPLLAPLVIPFGNLTCNQTKSVPPFPPYTQPKTVEFDDPINLGKSCVYTDPGTGLLFSVPFGGTYEATLSARNSAGSSAEGGRGPFTRPGSVPGVPTGLRIGG